MSHLNPQRLVVSLPIPATRAEHRKVFWFPLDPTLDPWGPLASGRPLEAAAAGGALHHGEGPTAGPAEARVPRVRALGRERRGGTGNPLKR